MLFLEIFKFSIWSKKPSCMSCTRSHTIIIPHHLIQWDYTGSKMKTSKYIIPLKYSTLDLLSFLMTNITFINIQSQYIRYIWKVCVLYQASWTVWTFVFTGSSDIVYPICSWTSGIISSINNGSLNFTYNSTLIVTL